MDPDQGETWRSTVADPAVRAHSGHVHAGGVRRMVVIVELLGSMMVKAAARSVTGPWLRVEGLGFRVWGLGFRVWG